MSNLQIIPVTTSRQKKQFLKLPWKIYQGDKYWIPPLQANQKALAGFSSHPFYNDAACQAFLAMRDGKPVGRILAIVNFAHNRRYKTTDGFFGFFETTDDSDVATGLLNAGRDWLKTQGMSTMHGPVNPSLNYEIGLLLDAFDSSPCFMMTYNKPYYQKRIEEAGFVKLKDAFAFWGHADMLSSLDEKLMFVAENVIERFDIKLRKMDKKNFVHDVRLFLDVYNRSMIGTWGFVPLSVAEIDHIAQEMKHLIVLDLTVVAEINDKPVGVMFALPDYNPRIKLIDGKLFPFGFMRLLSDRGAIRKVRAISTNVVPEYQQWGIGLALLSVLEKEVDKWGIDEAEFSWVLEDNHLSRASLERGGAILQKTYRLFQYDGKL